MNITIELDGKRYAGVLALVDETVAAVEKAVDPTTDPATI